MRAIFLAFVTFLMLPLAIGGAALAQSADRPNTILVLDGSGSMWGQIDGVNKIVIARNVIADMLEEMADDVSLGLTVYGHRQRGSCTDIETIVEPAPFTQDRILEAVNSINPRGRTPMTDAVVAAAQSLRSTEEAATVILVSDGIENCNPDPCAIAAELEAAGVAFTAHVIGFDVASEPEARAQMQCIADNTGGQFLTADNATELSAALEQVVAVLPVPTRIEAVVTPQFTPPTRPVSWNILDANGVAVVANVQGPAIQAELLPGDYIAQATRTEPEGPVTYQTTFSVSDPGQLPVQVAMPPIIETSQVTFTARVEPDMSVPASQLAWTLYDAADTVLLGPVVAPGGNVALLPGEYRLEVERANTGMRHEARFTVEAFTPQEVIIPLPALSVDISFVARIGDVGGVTITDPVIWEVTPLDPAPEIATANPATLPMTLGAYRVTAYWTVQEMEQSVDFVVVDQPREIIVVFPVPVATASVSGPAEAPMGSFIEVTWDGPANPADTISIGAVGARVTEYVNPVRIDVAANPAIVLMPSEAGPFEIRYTDSETREVIARTPILSTPVTATVTGPAEVTIGSAFEVSWTGPNYPNDLIVVTAPDASTNGYAPVRAATADGPIVTMTAPTEPGTYEIRYRMNQNGVILARATIEVVDEIASVIAPATAVAGSTIEVAWTGPDNDNDFIGITPVDAEGYNRFANLTGTDDGNPLDLLMPVEPGDYLIEYVLGQDRPRLAAVPITITPAEATITAPATAIAGSTIEVDWTGPDYRNDFIGITHVEAEGYNRFSNLTATDEGSPLDLLMPAEPGDYVIEYVLGQHRPTVTSVPITIVEASATLTAPATATAGSTIEIGWTGPGYENDFIGITRVGDEGYNRFDQMTRRLEDSPADLRMPTEPGAYVLEYVLGQGRSNLVEVPITVTELGATLTAPATATAGSTIEIGWTGPGYENDFIGITRVGDEGYNRFDQMSRRLEDSPADLRMPTEPGAYVLEYVLGQDRTSLTTVPITVTELGATITGPASAPAGSTVELGWTGPDYDNDFIGITEVGEDGYNRFANMSATRNGSPLDLLMPTEPGAYVLEYVLGQDRTNLTTVPFTVTEVAATLTAPATVNAGALVEIAWTGPGYDNDFIGLTPEGQDGYNRFEEMARVTDGSPLSMVMPGEPGNYVLEYVLGQDRSAIVTVPIVVTEADASITAPTTAIGGSTIEIAWTGPDNDGDYIGVGRVGATGANVWENFARTEDGATLQLQIPVEPGAYEITYFLRQDRQPLVTVPLTVTAAEATLTLPASAVAGTTIEVGWTGPDYDGDYIGIGRVGATGSNIWERFAYTENGSPAQIQVPIEPGSYEVSYFVRQGRVAIATAPITVTDITATVTAPATAIAGSTIQVAWSGPDYHDDYIGIGMVGATGGEVWENWAYTRDGNPSEIVVPALPGTYEIRYFARQDRRELAITTIEVTAAEASLTVPATLTAGSVVEVGWTGPDYRDDYIGIGRAGADGSNQWEAWAYTRDGNPASLDVPDEPGAYVIRYFMRQGRTVIAEVPVTVQ